MGKNTKMQQKKLKIAENEKASRPKKHKKERLRKLRKMGMTKKIGTITKRWISSIFLKKIHIFGTYSIRITANMMLGRQHTQAWQLPLKLITLVSIKIKIHELCAQLGREKAKESKTKSGQCTNELYQSSWLRYKGLVFLLGGTGGSKSKETIRKGKIDFNVNIEDDSPVHVNTKKRSIAEQKLDLLAKCTEAIVTKKINEQELKASAFSTYDEEMLNGLDKHRRTIAEKRICNVLFDAQKCQTKLRIQGMYSKWSGRST